MSFQDTLMNIVYIEDCRCEGVLHFDVGCAWCNDECVDTSFDFDRANEAKIDHENYHGIFLDTVAGEGLYYDPSENQGRESFPDWERHLDEFGQSYYTEA